MKNLDSTNFLLVYPDNTGEAVIKLKAGEVALFRMGTTGPYVKADTSSVNLQYLVVAE